MRRIRHRQESWTRLVIVLVKNEKSRRTIGEVPDLARSALAAAIVFSLCLGIVGVCERIGVCATPLKGMQLLRGACGAVWSGGRRTNLCDQREVIASCSTTGRLLCDHSKRSIRFPLSAFVHPLACLVIFHDAR